ncbi:MAG: FKBP-type peptidyl-prolyl cis-trans isomerase [Flavobacteriales bacterium]|jgi:FKBP-type peptidyl-prolyl cis-trans isomerase FklB|nr:FKBP-type peptidyl-prolyl cis-trans isomerase [Flavobacteriales bacterium]
MSDLKSEASYSVGMSIGQSLKGQNLDELDLNEFLNGVSNVLAGETLRFTPEEANGKIQAYLNEINESRFAQYKSEGEAFLAENAKRDEVTVTDSGLQYEVITEGNGEKPSPTAQVSVHYHGTLIDGSVFDSSVSRGTPATFGVTQVIRGWTEALQLMNVGAKWKLYIPQELAYGANPHPGGPIKPYMALIFEVELLSIS